MVYNVFMENNDKEKYDYLGRKLSWSGFDFDEEVLYEENDD